MKKMLVLYGSGRANGNTATLTKLVLSQLPAGSVEVEEIDLRKLENKFGGCSSCYGCQKVGNYRCVQKDETAALINRLPEFDLVLFASPVYFFNFSAQTKAFMDRLMALLKHEADGSMSTPLARMKFAYVMTSGGDENDSGVETAKVCAGYLAEFAAMPPPQFFYRGNCVDIAREIAGDPSLAAAAAQFAEELVK
ncbi:flavodoxin family protein [Victivallis sp. Marseille-Q1083]|uniref:flavodoxin family protein n=1 Tax=Victivallis sp. Marseille-Q1083 TaxID=2717288 RepID=UPI00158D7B9E|nr:flavodoxin family protein [Victivallis sp. Marseille-Q1083]